MKALLGSKALEHCINYINYIGRTPNDMDILGTFDDIQTFHKSIHIKSCYPFEDGKKYFAKDVSGNIYESEIAWPDSNSERLLKLIKDDPDTGYINGFMIPSLDVLYMLKMSHRYKKNSPHFLKTMNDIHMMRKWGAKIRPEHEEFYKERMKVTYDYGHPKLNQSKGNFFTDDVPYLYDHDSIHEAVKILDKPAYTFFKPEDSEVMVSKKMFDSLERTIQLYSVYEEACVLALERSLIPYPEGKTTKEAFDMALMKVCTSITSGWWREFAWEHYNDVQNIYHMQGDGHYVQKFYKGLAHGVVLPYKAGTTY